MRLIALANALYWIAASLVVLGGFVVFVASVTKHLWDRAVERQAESVRHIYQVNTKVDVYNIFFEANDGAPNSLRPLPAAGEVPELGTGIEPDRLRSLLLMLLRPESGDPSVTAEDLRREWTLIELAAALDLCMRAQEEGLSPHMQARAKRAADILREALAFQG
jgi:hypothetical protein